MISFFKKQYPSKDVIELLKKKRNNLAHRGNLDDIEDKDINNGRQIAEMAILFILYTQRNLKNINGLKLFYESASGSIEDIGQKEDILKYVRKLKEADPHKSTQ